MSEDSNELQRKIRELEEQIARLKEQSASHNSELHGDGAIALPGGKAVGKGGVLVEGNFQGNIYMGEDPAEDQKRLAIYLRMVRQATASLPLRGVDVGVSDPTQAQQSIGLANVYVDLDTTQSVKLTEKEKKARKPENSILGREENTRPLSVLEAAIQNRRLVLLGNPGGGKSTFGNFLAHCLAAHALEPQRGWLKHLSGWPEQEADLLPVSVVLRDFARGHADKLPAGAEPCHLLDFIKARLAAQNLGFAATPIEKALDAGKAIVLLDGLDEVPSQAQRLFVRNAVRALIQRYPNCRFLVSCRVLSYQQPEKGKPDLRLTELPAFEIAPFDQEKIDRFVGSWYGELGRLGSVPAADVDALTARLREAVRRPDLQRLASNPLLLTVMSLVHTHRGRLPDARALLYEETVDILLWRWEQIKLGGQEDAPRLRQYLLKAGRTDVDLKRALWELAYNAHAAVKPDAGGDGLADIGEHRILKTLAALKCDEANPEGDLSWAQNVVDLMKTRAGLLLERQPELFTFPHRTFQEYLAGAHLATQADFSRQVLALAQKDLALWREAILYAAGKLVYVNGDVDKALALVAELCPDDIDDRDAAWRLAWLAGDVLQEIGLQRVRDSAFGRDLLKRSQKRLKDLLESGKLAPKERVAAGNTLGVLGDPRFDPERWFLPCGETLGFVKIPAGKFIMGEEKAQHELNLSYDYWLGKYPVTVAQFRAFATATGKESNYERALRGFDNHPVRDISWFDAIGYCDWLTQRLSVAGKDFAGLDHPFWDGIRENKLRVTLPSEAEWEKVARSADGREYPWGERIDPNRANYDETAIGGPSPIGAFPAGASPDGLLDMSGNVWEWTRSLYRPYPYLAQDGREKVYIEQEYRNGGGKDEKGKDIIYCLRGGSFNLVADYARCAARGRNGPDHANVNLGFRVVVCSPFFSS